MRRWQLVLFLLAGFVILAPGRAWAAAIELFDANSRYTSGIFFPLAGADTQSVGLLTDAWTDRARRVGSVAADGVSLVLVRLLIPRNVSIVQVTVASDVPDADPGALWAIRDQGVLDTTAAGGTIDTVDTHRSLSLSVPPVFIGRQRFVLVLYRAPRNFDTASLSTGDMPSRTVKITAQARGLQATETVVTVVRPLVAFIHGTGANNDAWLRFPLWQGSANEVNGLTTGSLPFHATRISFNWIWNASGGVRDNAATILPQLVRAIHDWREATGTAATQADVVTHSFGGFIARQVVQTQPDPSPLSPKPFHNFRAAENWGHGSIHKLITLAATHRGAATANATADVNANGKTQGGLRHDACKAGVYLDKGALRDQMVLSPALGALEETRVPGHAVAGSGRASLDPSKTLEGGLLILLGSDKDGGPYQQAAFSALPDCYLDNLTNYIFSHNAKVPTVTESGGTCDVLPDYDVAVSTHSALGLMPKDATTTAADLGLVKVLNHSALHDPAAGSHEIVAHVSNRIAFLLKQATTSAHFGHFPAVRSVEPSQVEKDLSTIRAEWLEVGLETGDPCPAPSPPTCLDFNHQIQVVPKSLRLEDATETPLAVYGLHENEWVSARCVTLESDDHAVATIETNTVTGAQSVVPRGIGTTSISVTVTGNGTLTVPLTVTSPQ
jgi:pimeloyl-ACP methyl ester carboxylesterase